MKTFAGRELGRTSRANLDENQISSLEHIVADTKVLIKLTGAFFDRYSETHRRGDTAQDRSCCHPQSQDCRGVERSAVAACNVAANNAGHSLAVPCPKRKHPFSVEGGNKMRTNDWEGGGRRSRGTILECTGGDGVVQELDRRCYGLLESNSRLCLRVQALGLEYSVLARELSLVPRESKVRNRTGWSRRYCGMI